MDKVELCLDMYNRLKPCEFGACVLGLESILYTIEAELKKGNDITINGFGRFYTVELGGVVQPRYSPPRGGGNML